MSSERHFENFGVETGLLHRVLAKGLARGGDFCEIYLQHRINHWVGMEDGEVNRAHLSTDLGAGIRVLKDEATGYAYSEELTEESLLAAAEIASLVADGGPRTDLPAFSVQDRPADHHPIQTHWTEVPIAERLPIVQKLDTAIRSRDNRIVKVTVLLADERNRFLVVNSDGLMTGDDQPMASLRASCVAEHHGQVQTGGQSLAFRDGTGRFNDQAVADLAAELVDDTLVLFEAVPAPVGTWPVVLAAGASGILLHEAIGHGMEADYNRKGISIYSGQMGQRVADDQVTIVDDATVASLRGSLNVDDEGTPGQRTVLVENGILRSYLHDRLSARHYRTLSTGSGRRQSFRSPPVPRMSTTYMCAGTYLPEEIIASVKTGLYAEKFSNGQVTIGAGDFTFFLKKGRLIENGRLTHVVKDANLIGSGPAVLKTVDMVGRDLRIDAQGWTCGKDGQSVPVSQGLPTVRAGAMSIGGSEA